MPPCLATSAATKADARDVEVPVGAREGQPGGKELPDVVAVQQRDRPVAPLGQGLRQAAGDGGLTRARQAREEDGQAALGPGRAGAAQLTGHTRRGEPGGDLGPGIEQRAELGVGQLVALGAGLDQAERPPDLRARVVGPLAGADDRGSARPGRASAPFLIHRGHRPAPASPACRPAGAWPRRRRPRPRERAVRRPVRRRGGPAGRGRRACRRAGAAGRRARRGRGPPAG